MDAVIDFGPVFSYDNITIVILLVMCILQWGIIHKLLNSILAMRNVLENLSNMISILNERLRKHD